MAGLLYIDACAGLAGDMLAGALLELGWPLAELEALCRQMGLEEVGLEQERVQQQSMAASRLAVRSDEDQPHRHLHHVLELLAKLPPQVGGDAARVFTRLAQAEAKAHGIDPDQVHFHEVGAIDAIVDVVAFCAGLAWLGRPRLICSPLPLGRGFVHCAHGRLPLPAPAVLNLLEGAPLADWPAEEETVTPTGAALVSTLAEDYGPLPIMRLKGVGVGGGSRASSVAPNICRLLWGQPADQERAGVDQVVELVCHLDDQSPEDFPMIFERLMAAGALDVAASPLVMKKGRPAWQMIVLAPPGSAEPLAQLVLNQTTSLGLRMRWVQRRLLPRQVITLQSPWGQVRLKRAQAPDGVRLHPEAEDVARICRLTGLPPHQVRAEIIRLAQGLSD